MNKANKADFPKTSLNALTDPFDLTNQLCITLVIDGGWLLYMVKWEQHHITVEQCDNDADTSIVREALAAASDCSVEVRTICVCS